MLRLMLDTNEVWASMEPRVRAYFRRRVGRNDALVDELVQDILVRIHRGLPDLKQADRWQAWVMRMCRNVFIDQLRQRRHLTIIDNDSPAAPEVPSESVPLAIQRFLHDILEAIGEPHRSVVQLADFEGVPGPLAAQRLGLSLTAYKARLHRARERIRQELERCCEVVRDSCGAPIDFRRRSDGRDCDAGCSISAGQMSAGPVRNDAAGDPDRAQAR